MKNTRALLGGLFSGCVALLSACGGSSGEGGHGGDGNQPPPAAIVTIAVAPTTVAQAHSATSVSATLDVTAASAFTKSSLVVPDGSTPNVAQDPLLINPWGIAFSPASPIWTVFDRTFASIDVPGGFTDATLPEGYAPFGIQTLQIEDETRIVVTYAKQDLVATNEVVGAGVRPVNVFDSMARW